MESHEIFSSFHDILVGYELRLTFLFYIYLTFITFVWGFEI